jgi:hypothetical protein
MTLAVPCDACGTPLRRDVVTVKFTTSNVSFGMGSHTRLTPSSRQEYLVCQRCASYVQACIALLEERAAADSLRTQEAGS